MGKSRKRWVILTSIALLLAFTLVASGLFNEEHDELLPIKSVLVNEFGFKINEIKDEERTSYEVFASEKLDQSQFQRILKRANEVAPSINADVTSDWTVVFSIDADSDVYTHQLYIYPGNMDAYGTEAPRKMIALESVEYKHLNNPFAAFKRFFRRLS